MVGHQVSNKIRDGSIFRPYRAGAFVGSVPGVKTPGRVLKSLRDRRRRQPLMPGSSNRFFNSPLDYLEPPLRG